MTTIGNAAIAKLRNATTSAPLPAYHATEYAVENAEKPLTSRAKTAENVVVPDEISHIFVQK